jgi:uncharacterized protein (TIGR04222 family)
LSAVCIVVGWLCANADGTGSCSLPELARLDPFAAAALRGGSAAVIQTAVLSLWHKNLIKPKNQEQWSMRDDLEVEKERPQKNLLSPIEAEVLEFLQDFHTPSELLKTLRLRLKKYMKPVYDELEQLHLTRTKKHQTRAWLVAIPAASVILMVGGTKLYLGSIYEKPVGFLVLLLPGALVALFVASKPWKRLTKLGDRYLNTLQKEYSWLQNTTELERNAEGIDPAFCVAVFGTGALAGVPMYEAFHEIFQPAADS